MIPWDRTLPTEAKKAYETAVELVRQAHFEVTTVNQ